MPYPTIAGARTTTGTSFGGDVPNKIQRLLNDFDIADIDPTEIPRINTNFRFRNNRLQLFAGNTGFVVKHKTNNLAADAVVMYPDDLSTSVDNEFVFLEVAQEFKNKVIDTQFNSLIGIANANISNTAAIAKSKLAALAIGDSDVAGGITTAKLAEGSAFLKNTADNLLGSHFFQLTKIATPGNAAANSFNFYVDTADNKFKKKNSAGAVVDLEPTIPTTLDNLSDTTISSPANDQVLTYETSSTQWKNKSLIAQRIGTGQANGNNTSYSIAHNLGALPYAAFVQCYSHNIDLLYSWDATNINVTFASTTPAGTNNVKFVWSVIA